MIERARQAEMMAVLAQQPHAEAVDGAEEGAVERGEHLERHVGFDDALPRALLHLGGGAVRVGHDDERRQPFERARVLRAMATMRSVIARVLPLPAEATTEKLRSSSVMKRVALRLVDRRAHRLLLRAREIRDA